MKKFLAILLALVMVLALAACGGGDDKETTPSGSGSGSGTSNPTSEPEATEPPKPADAEPLPAEALNHWDFESADGLTAMYQIPKPADSELTGANKLIVESKHEIEFADGPVGKAVYLDGNYGIKLDMKAPTDDSYTIAFWYNGDRFFTYSPIVTMGRNMGLAANNDPATAVAWFNFTQCEWGADSSAPQLVPTVWNRNSSIPWAPNGTDDPGGVFPWVAGDKVYGKKEWAHVAVVVDGNRYTCLDDNGERIGTKLYINGVLMFDASAENLFYQGVAPEIFQHLDTAIRGLEAYIGINYWDDNYKGFIDDMYVYDEALTAGQITSLYQLGDPSVTSTAPEYTGPTDEEPETPPAAEITPDANALEAIGTTSLDAGFWTVHTKSYEMKDGTTTTFKFNNYAPGDADNYKSLYTVLCGISLEAGAVDPNTLEGYKEYAVVRPDIFAWSPAANPLDTATYEHSWGDDWAGYRAVMKDAEITLAITRAGATFTLDYTITGADGTVLTEKATIPTDAAADAPVYAFFGTDHAYVELLSVE